LEEVKNFKDLGESIRGVKIPSHAVSAVTKFLSPLKE